MLLLPDSQTSSCLQIFLIRVSVRVQQPPYSSFNRDHPLFPYTRTILVSFIGPWNFCLNVELGAILPAVFLSAPSRLQKVEVVAR